MYSHRLGIVLSVLFIVHVLVPVGLASQTARVTDLTVIVICTNGSVSAEQMNMVRVSVGDRQAAAGLAVPGHRLTEEWGGRYLIRIGTFIDVNGNGIRDVDEPALGYVAYWNGLPDQTVTIDVSFGVISVQISETYRDRSVLALAINPYGQGTTQSSVLAADFSETGHTVFYAANDNFLRDGFAVVLFVDRNGDGRYQQDVDDRVAQKPARWDSSNRIEVAF